MLTLSLMQVTLQFSDNSKPWFQPMLRHQTNQSKGWTNTWKKKSTHRKLLSISRCCKALNNLTATSCRRSSTFCLMLRPCKGLEISRNSLFLIPSKRWVVMEMSLSNSNSGIKRSKNKLSKGLLRLSKQRKGSLNF